MDINYIEGLNGIENAILNPRPYDWWMFGVTFANVIAFIILSIYIYILNSKIAKEQKKIQIAIANNQIDLQKRNLKLQLFERRYNLYKVFSDTIGASFLNIEDWFMKPNIEFGDPFNDNLLILRDKFILEYSYSQFLFEDEFVKVILEISNRFNTLVNYSTDIRRRYIMHDKKSLADLQRSFNFYLGGQTFFEWSEINKNNSPYLKALLDFSNIQKEYIDFIKENNIEVKFKTYLNISDLEQ